MSVLVEGISVIVRKETLQAKYPGGLVQYWMDCPNATFCHDSHLVRVGFMAATDVRVWLDRLEERGLVLEDEHETAVDIVVVDQLEGPTRACDWLLWGTHKVGFTLACLVGTDPTDKHFPRGWEYEKSLSHNFNRTIDKSEQSTWIQQATIGADGLLHRKDPVTDKVHHMALVWGTDEPSHLN